VKDSRFLSAHNAARRARAVARARRRRPTGSVQQVARSVPVTSRRGLLRLRLVDAVCGRVAGDVHRGESTSSSALGSSGSAVRTSGGAFPLRVAVSSQVNGSALWFASRRDASLVGECLNLVERRRAPVV
jgi:hypothetical protein